MSQPNIVYIMYDQAKASAMGYMGNRYSSTPFTDELAEQGWSFTQAYSSAPICTPSRASVHTGVYPLVHQVTCHQSRAPVNLPQLAELMQAGGYYTAVTGHYEPERDLSRGWHQQAAMHLKGQLNKSWQQRIGLGRKDVGWSSGNIDADREEGASYKLAERSLRMIRQAKKTNMPFFMHFCFDDPHPPYFVSRPYDTMFDPKTLPIPPRGEDDRLPRWQQACREQSGTYKATAEDIQKVLSVYYGLIRCVDDQFRRIYEELDRLGELENTWIIVGSDHGDYTGEKGLFNKSETPYECLLHVPLIIVPPKGSDYPGPLDIGHLVNTVDLFPTILRLAGLEVPEYCQGTDLVEWIKTGADEPIHDVLFSQIGEYHGFLGTTFPTGISAAGRHPGLLQSARSQTHSYIRDPDYGDEAYDLRSDPNELVDLLRDHPAGSTPEIAELKANVDAFEKECLELRERLGVIPGERGFVEGWE